MAVVKSGWYREEILFTPMNPSDSWVERVFFSIVHI